MCLVTHFHSFTNCFTHPFFQSFNHSLIHSFSVVLDEAHIIKNPSSGLHKSACELRTLYRWCLTGTPLQNKVRMRFFFLSVIHSCIYKLKTMLLHSTRTHTTYIYIYFYIYIYIYIYISIFYAHMYFVCPPDVVLILTPSQLLDLWALMKFLNLTPFKDRVHAYTHMHIYTYLYLHVLEGDVHRRCYTYAI